jgi:ABC-type phosphate transport system auxiliary subunit
VLEARKDMVQTLQQQVEEYHKLLETEKSLKIQMAIMRDRLDFLHSIPIKQVITMIMELKSQLQFQSRQMQITNCHVSRDRLLGAAERALLVSKRLNEEISLQTLQKELESKTILWEHANQSRMKIETEMGEMQKRIRELYRTISLSLSE